MSEGSITQEQADEVASTLVEAGVDHGGGHRGGGFALSAGAMALDMTEDEVRTALEADGTTLADVAGEQGVEDGRITQEQADEWLAELEERVTERVTSEAPVGGPGHGPCGDRG